MRAIEMSAEGRLWKITELAVALLTIAVPAYVAYDVYGLGPSPEKRVEIADGVSLDLSTGLSRLGDRATISFTVEGRTYDNLLIVTKYLANSGQAPILPSDYHKRLSVSINAPWKIVAIENGKYFGHEVTMDWERVSDTRFEAEPALINPGDQFSVSVYLTNTEFLGPFEAAPEPKLKWEARITNLRRFSKGPDSLERLQAKYSAFPPIIIHLKGWAVVFTIGAALVFQGLYVHLLVASGFLRTWTWKSIGLVVFTGLLSYAAAESMATYLFESVVTAISGVDHWMNAPPIILHAVFLAFLWWKSRTGDEKAPVHAG